MVEEAFGCHWRVEAVAGLSVRLFLVHARPTVRAKKDTSMPTMIFARFVCVLARNRSNDNPFLAYTWAFQLLKFPATASRACELDPSTPDCRWNRENWKLYCFAGGIKKQTFATFYVLYSLYSCWYIRSVISGVVLYSQKCFLYQMSTTRLLSHLPLVPHIGVSESGQHWFR